MNRATWVNSLIQWLKKTFRLRNRMALVFMLLASSFHYGCFIRKSDMLISAVGRSQRFEISIFRISPKVYFSKRGRFVMRCDEPLLKIRRCQGRYKRESDTLYITHTGPGCKCDVPKKFEMFEPGLLYGDRIWKIVDPYEK